LIEGSESGERAVVRGESGFDRGAGNVAHSQEWLCYWRAGLKTATTEREPACAVEEVVSKGKPKMATW